MGWGWNKPSRINPRRLRLIQSRHVVIGIEPDDQRTDAEGPHASALRVPLLHAGNVLGDVFNTDGVFDGEPVRLGFEPGFVDQDARVRVQPRERQHCVVVHQGDLRRCDPRVLQLERGPLLAAEYNDVSAFDANGAGS